MASKLPRVVTRVTPATAKRIQAAAAKAGLRVSKWHRRVLLRAVDEAEGRGARRTLLIEVTPDGQVKVLNEKGGAT